jgi:MFS family permease
LSGIEALIAFGGSLTGTSVMIYVVRDLTLPTGLLGMIFATGALGAIAGAFLAPGLGRRLGPGRAMTLGLAAFALGAICIPLAAVGGSAAIALLIAHQVVGDGGHTLHDVHDRTLRQTAVAPALMARVDAGIRSVGYVATLAGAVVGGLLGTAHGTRSVLVLAAASSAVATLLAAWTLGRRVTQPVAAR